MTKKRDLEILDELEDIKVERIKSFLYRDENKTKGNSKYMWIIKKPNSPVKEEIYVFQLNWNWVAMGAGITTKLKGLNNKEQAIKFAKEKLLNVK